MVSAVMLAVLTACGGGSDDDKGPIDSKTSAAPTPTRTTTGTLLDLVPPKPERPADENTKAGAIAFADYVFKVISYGEGIGDAAPLTSIIDERRCAGCKLYLDNIKTSNKFNVVGVGSEPISTTKAKVVNVDGDFSTVSLTVNYPESVVIDADSGKASGDRQPKFTEATTVNLQWVDGKWRVLDVKSKDN